MDDDSIPEELREVFSRLSPEERAAARAWMIARYDDQGEAFKGRKVFLLAEDTDPRFVAAYDAANVAEFRFEDVLQAVGMLPIPGNDREKESLRRLSIFLGTLFGETMAASVQVSLLEMPRAQYMLNRQLLEYSARNQWFLQHKAMAVAELDRLPKAVYKEVEAHRGAFRDPAFVQQITDNYRDWASANPTLDSAPHPVPGPTKMVESSLDDANDVFWYYGGPSLFVHGKTHAIQDVLRKRADGTLERSPNSVWLERVSLLYHAANLTLRYGALLALNFGVDGTGISSAAEQLEKTMRDDGIEPLPTTVKRYI